MSDTEASSPEQSGSQISTCIDEQDEDDSSVLSSFANNGYTTENSDPLQPRNSLTKACSCGCREERKETTPKKGVARAPQQQIPPGVKQRRQQQQQQFASTHRSQFRRNISNISQLGGEPVVVLGMDISHLSGPYQFCVCAAGVFGFNLSFGYLQEFVSVEICNRNLGLFLAMIQFAGYTALSYGMRTLVNHREAKAARVKHSHPKVPVHMYIGLGVLSAIDMAMTNMAMHYINYPAKTLMKSSRVVFTMIFGVLMAGKRYRLVDYLVVLCMVAGLAIFMQADATSNAIFEPLGVIMLTISLLCDGATNIMSETIMKNYGVGQDELIFRMYSLALIAVTATAMFFGDLRIGMLWLSRPGTYDEWTAGVAEEEITWDVVGKVTMIVLFSSMGFFGSSCSAAITKNFGALTMSMTSTVRRAATLFISFFLFDNECTYEHIFGVVVFITALTTKSFMGKKKAPKTKVPLSPPPKPLKDLEGQMGEEDALTFGGSKGNASSRRKQQRIRSKGQQARSYRISGRRA
ncbi:Adenosine 3'-phospho 5'-phosphosulfate transporter 2 [Seminavis robusta]|uniref:Adenosine 3'-phospho 5'-phosphosulfate transporter 2 n=1 Tax=Seminavis robusta TaxID=568900 RepID=A0A9N8E255_9STRA|nr:Adenosine 3'-phospho 5'-phosphosulfate transporter 2 [Seminavis robusta]|eukprot:Sro576_g169580.1 Adenosine 3'-phospho 5'-phosphosulfate transporter 2 (521) ;mRNA; r:54919-56691